MATLTPFFPGDIVIVNLDSDSSEDRPAVVCAPEFASVPPDILYYRVKLFDEDELSNTRHWVSHLSIRPFVPTLSQLSGPRASLFLAARELADSRGLGGWQVCRPRDRDSCPIGGALPAKPPTTPPTTRCQALDGAEPGAEYGAALLAHGAVALPGEWVQAKGLLIRVEHIYQNRIEGTGVHLVGGDAVLAPAVAELKDVSISRPPQKKVLAKLGPVRKIAKPKREVKPVAPVVAPAPAPVVVPKPAPAPAPAPTMTPTPTPTPTTATATSAPAPAPTSAAVPANFFPAHFNTQELINPLPAGYVPANLLHDIIIPPSVAPEMPCVCAFCGKDDPTLGDLIGPVAQQPKALVAALGEAGLAGLLAPELPQAVKRRLDPRNLRYFHHHCAFYSPEVWCADPADVAAAGGAEAGLSVDSSGAAWYNVSKALRRAPGRPCTFCKGAGGTVGCWVPACPVSVHVGCAKAKGWEFDARDRCYFCPKHQYL